jgi:hypothetical protein
VVVACCCGRDLDFQSVRRLVRALLCKGTPVICLYHCENQTYAHQRSWPERVCRAAGVWLCVGSMLVMLVGTHTHTHTHAQNITTQIIDQLRSLLAKTTTTTDGGGGDSQGREVAMVLLHDEEERTGAQKIIIISSSRP